MATPRPPAPLMLSAPFEKPAAPWPPKAVLSWAMKLAGVKAGPAAPFTVIDPASKSMSIRRWMTPFASVRAIVVLPVKPVSAAWASSPVLRPVRLVGAGTEEAALAARLISSVAREVNSPSWSDRLTSSVLRTSIKPRISPLEMFSGVG